MYLTTFTTNLYNRLILSKGSVMIYRPSQTKKDSETKNRG